MPFVVVVSLSAQRACLGAIAERLNRARLVLSAESCRRHKRVVALVWTYLGKADQQCLCKPQHDGVWVTGERRSRDTSNTATDATSEATCNEDLNALADTVQKKPRGIMVALFHCAPKQGTRADRPQRPVSMLAPCALPRRIPRRKRQSRMVLVAGTMMHHCLLTPAPPPWGLLSGHRVSLWTPKEAAVVLLAAGSTSASGVDMDIQGLPNSCRRPQSRHQCVDILHSLCPAPTPRGHRLHIRLHSSRAPGQCMSRAQGLVHRHLPSSDVHTSSPSEAFLDATQPSKL